MLPEVYNPYFSLKMEGTIEVVIAKEVLSDALVNALSKKIDIALYPVSDFAVDLGFDFVAASAAEEHAKLTSNPQGKYEHLLKKFVDAHGRGARDLINIFKNKRKNDLVNFLKEAIKKQNAFNQSGLGQEPGLAEGQGQTGTEIHPLNAGASARNKSFRKSVAVLGVVVVLLACGLACDWNNNIPEYIAETFSLEECQVTLRKHYEDQLFKIHIQPLKSYDYVNLEKLYTTVSLYKEDKNNIPDKPLQKSTLNGSVNDILQTKVRGSLPRRIVLFGEAGRGKTTAVAKMAYDWANKKKDSPLKNVKLLFVFKMRNMNAKTGLTEAIVSLLGKKYKKFQKQLEEYIDSHEKNIVMLFDGYDEFSGELHCKDNVGDIIDILCQKRCRQCRVLVTSRPVRKEDFDSRDVYYTKMVIEGYSQQHTTDFINKFFLSNETKGAELKKYLEEDIVTNEMISTPLFCTMVCYLWNDGNIHGNFTRTKLFDRIMELLRAHLNAKDEREINRTQLYDILVSVGKVAFTKLSNKRDLYPLVLSKNDFSEVHDNKVNNSYSLGLLTRNMKTDSDMETDSDTSIQIEFFHKLAQEYSAGRYLASGLDEGKISHISHIWSSDIDDDMKEIFQFASGTSVTACRKILESLIHGFLWFDLSNNIRIIFDILTEAGTCADVFETYSKKFFNGKLPLQITASEVVKFEKLPRSVKEKITAIDISGKTSSLDVFERLWNSMHTCIHLTHVEMSRDVPPNIWPQMEPLCSVNSFTTGILPSADYYAQIMVFLPNLRELMIYYDESQDLPDLPVFGGLWNQLNSSSLLIRLSLPIPADIGFNLKHLTSILVFETNYVNSVSSLIHVLTLLPKVRVLIIQEKELVKLNKNTEAFCKLWKNLQTSPDLKRLQLPIPAHIPCHLEPLRSVQVLETKSSSIHLPIVLNNLPNLKELHLNSDIPEYPEVDVESAHTFFVHFWSVLHILHELHYLYMNVPEAVPTSFVLEPLRSVKFFETRINSQTEVFPLLISRLPNISQLYVFATNDNYDRKIAEDTYFDKVVSTITYGLVKNGVQLEYLWIELVPKKDASKTVSSDTVANFIRMLKTSRMMRQLKIFSYDYCVFNQSDLIEILTTIIEFTSIRYLGIKCSLHHEDELSRFADQRHQTQEENQEVSKIEQSGSLMLTLFYSFQGKCSTNFVLPRPTNHAEFGLEVRLLKPGAILTVFLFGSGLGLGVLALIFYMHCV